jgi:hypothetical protein
MLSVPFGSAELNIPIRFEYDNMGFELNIAGETIGKFKFRLSVAKDITNIEEALDEFLTKNPQYVTFYNHGVGDKNRINIPDGDNIIFNHIVQWCKHWNIDITEFNKLVDIVNKFGNDTDPLTFKINGQIFDQSTSLITNYTDLMANGTNIEFTNTTICDTTTSNLYQRNEHNYMLAPIFNMNTEIKFQTLSNTSSQTFNFDDPIVYMDVISNKIPLYIFRNKLVPLFALKYINPRLQYILDDILNMSKRKYSHFILCLDDIFSISSMELLNDISMVHGIDIEDLHKEAVTYMSKDNPAMYRFFYKRADVIAEIINTIPKFIDDFPFNNQRFAIPNISARPQTSLQWMMTNIIALKTINFNSYLKKLDLSFIKDVKGNTKTLLTAIHTPIKTLDMYLKYTHMLTDDGIFKDAVMHTKVQGDSNLYEYGMREDELAKICNQMIDFIADGKRIFNEYPDPVDLGEMGIIKMVPVTGTYLKQMRNTIYNHRMEIKITLDYKLQQLHKSSKTNNLMKCDVNLSPELEECRIKFKDEMILLGSTLKHCLGTYTESNDLFFRRENVCAQIRMPTFQLGQCYDREDKITEKSKEFGEWLITNINMWCARLYHEDITAETGIELNDFDDYIDEIGDIVRQNNMFRLLTGDHVNTRCYANGVAERLNVVDG